MSVNSTMDIFRTCHRRFCVLIYHGNSWGIMDVGDDGGDGGDGGDVGNGDFTPTIQLHI